MVRNPIEPIRFHCFVSYQSNDWEAAQQLTFLLQGVGLRAWWDKDPGQHDQSRRFPGDPRGKPISGDDARIESVLESAASASMFLTVITSPHTLRSVWIRKEIDIALRLRRPLYFWHVTRPGESTSVSVRRSGNVPATGLWPHNIESIVQHYENEPLPCPASIEFTKELFEKQDLNRLGHTIKPLSQAKAVGAELIRLIEISELVVHEGRALNSESIDSLWPRYDGLCQDAEQLQKQVEDQFGRQVEVGRVPVGDVFGLKRPFVLTRIRHLERLLTDEEFRSREFAKLGD